MSVLIVIPARFASTRYPGKPLVPLTGATGIKRSLIERSWRAACDVTGADRVVVATDDARIQEAADAFGAEVVMTSASCRNGTERCAEVAQKLPDYDILVNLQGDAPLTPPWFIEALIERMQSDTSLDAATPVLQCDGKTLMNLRADRQAGRVGGTTAVFDSLHKALYFSKEVIPFTAQVYAASDPTPVFHHVGAYAYRRGALQEYLSWPEGPLERLEGLEQLRFLENRHVMACVEVDAKGREFWELNNPEDVPKIEAMMKLMGLS